MAVLGRKRWLVAGAMVLVLLLAGGAGTWLYAQRSTSPVPASIRKSIDFPVYYPDAKKLPAGYRLDTTSFKSPQSGVIIYTVLDPHNQKLIFSVQEKPADSDIQNFYTNYIPLRNHLQLPIGPLEIGAYGSGKNLKTVASVVPTNDKSWIIVTTPYNINQNQLKQVLTSLKK